MPFQSASGTKRNDVAASAASSSALLVATLPTSSQVLPSSVYCQAPLVLSAPTIARPFWAPPSTSHDPLTKLETSQVFPPSSLVEPSTTPGMPGASLTAVTVIVAVSVAVLNALSPTLVLVSTLLPALPLLWSQARNVTSAVSAF